MKRFYQLAGTVIGVTGPEGKMDCEDSVLSAYECPEQDVDHWLEFSIVEQVASPEGILVYAAPTKQIYIDGDTQIRYEGTVSTAPEDAYIRIARQGNRSRIQVASRFLAERITAKLVLNSMEAEHIIAQKQGLLLHAACIRWKDKAILFTAPSGTGKSTQAELWCRLRGAELINGDRAAVMVEPQGIMVRGIPFCGSSGVSKNVSLPLLAVVYLSQAKETVACRLSGVPAFRKIWEGCSVNVWNREDVDLSTRTALEVATVVPVYHLACTPDESAVIALEQILDKSPNI